MGLIDLLISNRKRQSRYTFEVQFTGNITSSICLGYHYKLESASFELEEMLKSQYTPYIVYTDDGAGNKVKSLHDIISYRLLKVDLADF